MKGSRSGRGASSGKLPLAASKERSQNSRAASKISSNGSSSGGGGSVNGGGGISKPLEIRAPQGRVSDGGSSSSSPLSSAAAVGGDAGSSRPLSAGKGHAPSGRKQALVKAVPRTDLPSHTDLRDQVSDRRLTLCVYMYMCVRVCVCVCVRVCVCV